MTEHDRALEAFHRLLADGSAGGQAKVDALVALSQRTVLVPVWSQANDAFRTLVNPQGETALPVFTSAALLQAAGRRFGWLDGGGTVPSREVGSRAALRHAVAHTLPFVVVDIASPHALEIAQSEITPLLSPEAHREAQGPYAGVGRLSSSMLQAVKATPPPGAVEAPRATPAPGERADDQTTGVRSRSPAPAPLPVHETEGSAARASQPAPAPVEAGVPDPTRSGGATPNRGTPLAHVLGERQRRTPRSQPAATPLKGAMRESARPPAMDPTGAYGAATRAQRREVAGRTPPSGGIRLPSTQPPRGGASGRPSLHSDVPAGMGAAPGAVSAQDARITPLGHTPSEALIAAAAGVLRDYPEVEWAAYCFAARGRGGPTPALGLRVDDSFRQRVGEIVLALRTAGAEAGTDVDVLLLDDPEMTRAARSQGLVFYPWRRTPSQADA
jgi:hypothetical protein